jgi:hypothetical protein
MDQRNLAGELTALLDEAVPARDLGLCFSYTITEEPFHTRLTNVETYEEIREIMVEMGIDLGP